MLWGDDDDDDAPQPQPEGDISEVEVIEAEEIIDDDEQQPKD